MVEVSIYDLKTNLSRYINELESGINDSILITKNGIVVAEIIRKKKSQGKIKFGIGKQFLDQNNLNDHLFDPFAHDDEITEMFLEAINNDDFAWYTYCILAIAWWWENSISN